MKDPREKLDHHDLLGKWGHVAEKVTADQKLVESITTVLGFEQAMSDLDFHDKAGERRFLPSDVAMREISFNDGVAAGFSMALTALTDAEHIVEQRKKLTERIEDENGE